MDTKIIRILIAVAVAAVLAVLLIDQLSNRPGKRPDNPFAIDMEGHDRTDSGLLTYREVKQLAIGHERPMGLAFGYGRIFLITTDYLQVISPEGASMKKRALEEAPTCIAIGNKKNVLIGFERHLALYDLSGELLLRSEPLDEKAAITAVAFSEELIFVADAGNKQVRIYNHRLEKVGVFAGTSVVSEAHGFILRSGHFDLAVNHDDELWVVNPGIHKLQHYAHSGRLRGYWGTTSFDPVGFSGCCNPVYVTFLPNGDFVTSEKGLVRVKIYQPSGILRGVVAGPEHFPNGRVAPAIATDHEGNLYLLDFEKQLIRIFEEKKDKRHHE